MAVDAPQEKALIARCIQGNKDAWRDFICRYSSLVYYIIQKVLYGSHCDAAREEIDDLHNDIFLSIIDNNGKKLSQYEGKNGCTVSSWVRMIAVRSTIDYLRKKRDTLSLWNSCPLHPATLSRTLKTLNANSFCAALSQRFRRRISSF
jgi:DNA-directed RNA polymerase specialized sigma24 family protein